MRIQYLIPFAVLVGLAPGTPQAGAQSFRRAGTEFNAMRPVEVPAGKDYSVIQVEFFHHGEITPDGANVRVFTRSREAVATRVLQLGPGDFCRLAFQTASGQSSYEIYYGGPPPAEEPPAWTATEGLLLETRQYQDCNLNRLESVRQAFESAKPIGAGYVENVQHSHNPFSLAREPFLSRYQGTLRVPSAGTYGFLTSSQDASFLLIDGKVVVDAPGRHGPLRRATRGTRKDVPLTQGPHRFEYYHAAAGPQAMMVAAWEVAPRDPKPQPAAIPSDLFLTQRVGHLPCGRVTTRTAKLVPDFLVKLAGAVPLPDNDQPLVGVQFMDFSARGLTMTGKLTWDFGDGQTRQEPNPFHVYLRPGLYPITLSVKRGTRTVATTNRVMIGPPKEFQRKKAHRVEQYLPVFDTYDPKRLDAASLRQLVLAYQFLADRALAPDREGGGTKEAGGPAEGSAPAAAAGREADEDRRAREYLAAAVEAGKVAFLEESAAEGDRELIQLARLVAPLARTEIGDSLLAAKIWYGAASRISDPELRAECEIASADTSVNDLVNQKAARTLLAAAASHLGRNTGPLASRLRKVQGDFYALTGDGERARQAYREAEAALGPGRSYAERTAWRGAHARSTEQFLKTGELPRACRQIHAWESQFPADRIDGYLTLLYARYWAARQLYDQAVALAQQLENVNPDSPYVDQILLLAAECELARGNVPRARATLQSILTHYPGSPLVPDVRAKIEALPADAPDASPTRSD